MEDNFCIILSKQEKIECLSEICKKLKKIIYVYEMSQKDTNYNYKVFIKGLILYISSSDILFNGKLINILINLNSILVNDFDKKQLKSTVFETINIAQYLMSLEDGDEK